MSLRTRLILSYVALMLVLGLGAWWGLQRLTDDLTAALGESAASVGRSVFTVLRRERDVLTTSGSDSVPGDADAEVSRSHEISQTHRIVTQREMTVLRGKAPGEAGADAGASNGETLRVIVDGRELDADEIAGMQSADSTTSALDLRQELREGRPTLVLSGQGFTRTIPLPRSGMDSALQKHTQQLGWGLLALLALGMAVSVWLAQRIARPLRTLATAARSVGEGALGMQAPVPDGGVAEVRQTIVAFNQMSARLQQLDAEAGALRADRELAELGEIGRGLAHSLRNPLHALGLSLEALAAQASDSEHALSMALAGREQLQRVDLALRGFLALSAGQGATIAPASLREVIDDVLLEASQRAQGRVRFRVEGEDVRIPAVAAELRVMLHALVINALDASPEGSEVCVQIRRSAESEAQVEIDVCDEGEGVPEAVHAQLFQPHVSSKPHGAGMGLYLAQRLARLRHAGGIELHPRMPRGTRARLRLMRRTSHD